MSGDKNRSPFWAAYHLGYEARFKYVFRNENPYDDDSSEHYDWECGWNCADSDHERWDRAALDSDDE